jgi:hypothetical protein
VNDTDTFDDQQYWYEYVVVDAAIKALQKEESDCTYLMNQKEALRSRIEVMASDRDFSVPDQAGRKGNGSTYRGPGSPGGGWGGGMGY